MTQLSEARKELGHRQTWQDMTGSRSAGVEYTNTTGRTIFVGAHFYSDVTSGRAMGFTVDGVQLYHCQNAATSDSRAKEPCLVGVVPDGSTYAISATGLTKWFELR